MRPDGSNDDAEVQSLQYGLSLGMSLIDTAEMYAAGHSEEIVARAIDGQRDRVLVASKVSPQHFHYEDVLRSAKKSLERLRVSMIDLYQLHWPNTSVPISETMRAMERLVGDGLVRYIGVSNFSVGQVREAQSSLSRESIVSNQVEYSLLDRTPESDGVLEQCEKEKITLIAYSPLGQGRLLRGRGGPLEVLDRIARRHEKTRAQVGLNWLLRKSEVVVIPKAADKKHVRENAEAVGWQMSTAELDELDKAFR